MLDNLIDLSIYIKSESLKKKCGEDFVNITNINEAEDIAYKVSNGEIYNIIFETSSLKERFFSIIETNRPDINIINCNTNISIFNRNMQSIKYPILYNNIDKCKDNDILNIIRNKKGIIIC